MGDGQVARRAAYTYASMSQVQVLRRRACAGLQVCALCAGVRVQEQVSARCCGACAGHQVYTRGHVRAGSQAPQVQVQVRVRWDNITRKIDARVDRNDPFSPQFLSQPIKDYTITQTFWAATAYTTHPYRTPTRNSCQRNTPHPTRRVAFGSSCEAKDAEKSENRARREPRQRNRTSKLRSKSNDSGSNSDSLAASP